VTRAGWCGKVVEVAKHTATTGSGSGVVDTRSDVTLRHPSPTQALDFFQGKTRYE
jgi:hypothetical protein